MLHNGLANLNLQIDKINNLNVFPVADGDTGTNMFKTLENGIKNARQSSDCCVYLKGLSEGMLYGARGNSGVILSQFFCGMYKELSGDELIGPGELRNGLIMGYKAAYKAVLKPVEGTILTVCREGIENIRSQINRNSSIESILSMYIAEMKKVLSFTPEMLSVLKESNVVDSGAYGFICIFEGMLKYLYDEIIDFNNSSEISKPQTENSVFDENSEFIEGYCLEFILQLMKSSDYNQHFDLERFKKDLSLYGSSIVAVQDNTKIKVHIHTLHPARTVSLCEEYGVFIDFKLENMQLQKNNFKAENSVPKIPLAKIAVVNGNGLKQIYKELGCDVIIDSVSGYNTSTQEFINAVNSVNADKTVIITNNKNSVMSAMQVKNMINTKDITVIPTNNPIEGYFSLAMDIPDDNNIDNRINQMINGSDGNNTISITKASKDYISDNVSCTVGDYIAFCDNEITCSSKSLFECVISALKSIEDINYKDSCIIFAGIDTNEDEIEDLEDKISDNFENLEIEILKGDQDIYPYMIGLV